MHRIDVPQRQFDLAVEHDLSKTEDAPMSIAVLPDVSLKQPVGMASPVASRRFSLTSPFQSKVLVAGINSAADKLKEGVNENLRVFSYDSDS